MAGTLVFLWKIIRKVEFSQLYNSCFDSFQIALPCHVIFSFTIYLQCPLQNDWHRPISHFRWYKFLLPAKSSDINNNHNKSLLSQGTCRSCILRWVSHWTLTCVCAMETSSIKTLITIFLLLHLWTTSYSASNLTYPSWEHVCMVTFLFVSITYYKMKKLEFFV